MKPEIETRTVDRYMKMSDVPIERQFHISPEIFAMHTPVIQEKEMRIKVNGEWSQWTKVK
jgi:hypothetical protein